MVERKCAGCGKIKNRNELIKITLQSSCENSETVVDKNIPDNKLEIQQKNVVINNDNKIFGRSVYLCYNDACIEAAFKKDKISKILKAPIPKDLKGKLLNEF